jgi:hypothetical protein
MSENNRIKKNTIALPFMSIAGVLLHRRVAC